MFLNTEFQKWYSSEISKQVLITGDVKTIDPIDLTTSKMKCVSAQWFIRRFFQYMQDRPDIVVNGFKAIAQSIDDGVPFLDNVIDDDDFDSSDDDGTDAYFSDESV